MRAARGPSGRARRAESGRAVSARSEVPALRVIDAGTSPDEVAAIVAAVSVALGAGTDAGVDAGEEPSGWITAARLRTRGSGMRRGDWRSSTRLGGRVPT